MMKIIPERFGAHYIIHLLYVFITDNVSIQFYNIVFNIPGLGWTQSSSILPSPSSSVSRVISNKKDILVDIHDIESVTK